MSTCLMTSFSLTSLKPSMLRDQDIIIDIKPSGHKIN